VICYPNASRTFRPITTETPVVHCPTEDARRAVPQRKGVRRAWQLAPSSHGNGWAPPHHQRQRKDERGNAHKAAPPLCWLDSFARNSASVISGRPVTASKMSAERASVRCDLRSPPCRLGAISPFDATSPASGSRSMRSPQTSQRPYDLTSHPQWRRSHDGEDQ
jgi:hypothetical protein